MAMGDKTKVLCIIKRNISGFGNEYFINNAEHCESLDIEMESDICANSEQGFLLAQRAATVNLCSICKQNPFDESFMVIVAI